MNISREVLKTLKNILPTYVSNGTELYSFKVDEGDLFFDYGYCTVYMHRNSQYHILWKSREYC